MRTFDQVVVLSCALIKQTDSDPQLNASVGSHTSGDPGEDEDSKKS